MRILIAAPLLFLLVLFALSNKQTVDLTLWPTDVAVALPLSLAVLGIAGLFFLFGALVAWAGTLGERSRARRAEAVVRQLEAQLAAARAQLDARVAADARAAARRAGIPAAEPRTLSIAGR